MPIPSGDFTASQLATVIEKADAIFADDMRKADYEANVEVFNAIKAEQGGNRVEAVLDGPKDNVVRITWLNQCDETVEDDTDDCEPGGPQLHSDSKEYELDIAKKKGFTVGEKEWRTNKFDMEEAVAVGFLAADKALSEMVAQTIVSKLELWKGTNQVNDGIGYVNTVTGDTDIADAYWTAKMLAYFKRVGVMNRFSNPFMISGANLWEESFIAQKYVGNDNGKGDAAMFNSVIRSYWDLWNVDTVNSPDLKTYLINRGSIAFASKNYESRVPRNVAKQQRYSIASRFLSGVEYDVVYESTCQGNNIFHNYTLHLKFGVFLNPTGCNPERTGIIAFNKV